MKRQKSRFLIVFIAANVTMIFLIIYKHALFNKLSYKNQTLENEYRQLESQRESLKQELSKLEHPSRIKKFAREQGMQDLSIKQISKIKKAE